MEIIRQTDLVLGWIALARCWPAYQRARSLSLISPDGRALMQQLLDAGADERDITQGIERLLFHLA